jgi:hypothetical protein
MRRCAELGGLDRDIDKLSVFFIDGWTITLAASDQFVILMKSAVNAQGETFTPMKK